MLPEWSTLTLVLDEGERIAARVLKRGSDTLLVAITVRAEQLSAAQLEGMVLEFMTAQGRVRLGGTPTAPDPSHPNVLRIDGLHPLGVIQKREYARVDLRRPVLMYPDSGQAPVEGYTVDLSGGGFLLAGVDSLEVGETAEFLLALTPELAIRTRGKVVRLDPEGRRAVGFDSISDFDRRRIVHFVFECQRAERRRHMEMYDRDGS